MIKKSTIQKVLSTGFAAIASLVEDVTLIREALASYDPTTGTVVNSETRRTITGILRSFKQTDRLPDNILADDKVFVTESTQFDDDIPDSKTDRLDYGGVVYEIVPPVLEDPTRTILSIQLRKIK